MWLLIHACPSPNDIVYIVCVGGGGGGGFGLHLGDISYSFESVMCLNMYICTTLVLSPVCMAPIIVVFVLSLCYGYGVTVCKYVLR